MTNLRATGATTLYSANVPENMIQQRTGHLSLKGLRTYEHNSEEVVSKIVTSDSKLEYSEVLHSESEHAVQST